MHIRHAEESDHKFIYNAFLKSWRHSAVAKHITDTLYYSQQHSMITHFLQDPNTLKLVLCRKDDLSSILGFLIAEVIQGHPVIHYIYVKYQERQKGYASTMLSYLLDHTESTGCYTHYARSFETLSKKFNLYYNPYVLYSMHFLQHISTKEHQDGE